MIFLTVSLYSGVVLKLRDAIYNTVVPGTSI